MGTGRRGTVAGKVYLARAGVLRVVRMLSQPVGGQQEQQPPLQPMEGEVDGLEG